MTTPKIYDFDKVMEENDWIFPWQDVRPGDSIVFRNVNLTFPSLTKKGDAYDYRRTVDFVPNVPYLCIYVAIVEKSFDRIVEFIFLGPGVTFEDVFCWEIRK